MNRVQVLDRVISVNQELVILDFGLEGSDAGLGCLDLLCDLFFLVISEAFASAAVVGESGEG